jgi:hypothetical protein
MIIKPTPERNDKYILNVKAMAAKSCLMELTLGSWQRVSIQNYMLHNLIFKVSDCCNNTAWGQKFII